MEAPFSGLALEELHKGESGFMLFQHLEVASLGGAQLVALPLFMQSSQAHFSSAVGPELLPPA